MSGDLRGLTQRELLDLFDRCEAHPGIRQAIREVLQPNAALIPEGAVLVTEESLAAAASRHARLDHPGTPCWWTEAQGPTCAAAILRHLREAT